MDKMDRLLGILESIAGEVKALKKEVFELTQGEFKDVASKRLQEKATEDEAEHLLKLISTLPTE